MTKWFTGNDADPVRTARGARPDLEGLRHGAHAVVVHRIRPLSRLHDRLGTHSVPVLRVEADAATGTLSDFSLIEPDILSGHGDSTRPWAARSATRWRSRSTAPRRCCRAKRSCPGCTTPTARPPSRDGTNVWNTTLLIGWDEPGGTYDHVVPGPVPPPDPAASAGELGFTFDRSGYRVPAIIVSPWVESGSVYNEEYRHTSLIATLRKRWELGDTFTQPTPRRAFDHVFSLDTPHDPGTSVTPTPHPVPA